MRINWSFMRRKHVVHVCVGKARWHFNLLLVTIHIDVSKRKKNH